MWGSWGRGIWKKEREQSRPNGKRDGMGKADLKALVVGNSNAKTPFCLSPDSIMVFSIASNFRPGPLDPCKHPCRICNFIVYSDYGGTAPGFCVFHGVEAANLACGIYKTWALSL